MVCDRNRVTGENFTSDQKSSERQASQPARPLAHFSRVRQPEFEFAKVGQAFSTSSSMISIIRS